MTHDTQQEASSLQHALSMTDTPILHSELAATGGAALVGFAQTGTAVLRTGQDKLREVISVRDFGAMGDGVADDTAAFQRAFDYAVSLNGCEVDLGFGSFKILGTITISATGNLWLRMRGRGKATRINHAGDCALFYFSNNVADIDASNFWIYSTSAKSSNDYAVFYFRLGNTSSTYENLNYYGYGDGHTGSAFYVVGPSTVTDSVNFINNYISVTGVGYQIGSGSSITWIGGRIIGNGNTGSSTGVFFSGGNGGCWFQGTDIILHRFGVRATQENGMSNRELFFSQSCFDGCYTGLSIEDGYSYTSIIGCWAASCDNACIAFSATDDQALLSISGGTVFNAGASGNPGMQAGIVKTGKGRMHITGVTFRENNFAGIYWNNEVSGVYDKVADCQFYDNGSAIANSAQVKIVGRVIFNNNYIDSSFYGVPPVTLDPSSQSLMKLKDNIGFTGQGVVANPVTPASGLPIANNTGIHAHVYIVGGSVSAVALNGTSIAAYSPSSPANVQVYLRPGDTFSITYSSVPTLIWDYL